MKKHSIKKIKLKKRKQTKRIKQRGGIKMEKEDVKAEIVYADFFKTKTFSDMQLYKNGLKGPGLKKFKEEFIDTAWYFDAYLKQILDEQEMLVPININNHFPYKKWFEENKNKLCKGRENTDTMISSTILGMEIEIHPTFILFLKHRSTDEIIGFCQVIIYEQEINKVEINYLCGSDDHSGVGKIIIDIVKQITGHLDIHYIYLQSYESSQGFYEKMGFVCKKSSFAVFPEQLWDCTFRL